MLEGLKRWFGGAAPAPAAGAAAPSLAAWAEARQYSFRVVRESGGFVIDGRLGALPWRLEWGPSQRAYVGGSELRLRAELGLGNDLQVVVLDRPLQEAMEKTVFDQYVEGVQTRIDNQTPPEMRWLVMFPKLTGSEMGALRQRFAALSSIKTFLQQWLQGPLTTALQAAPLVAGKPMVLMISRGRLSLRTAMADPDSADIEAWLRLFETAMREARRVASQGADPGAPSTQPSLWAPGTAADDRKG
ncbi:MAG: hypothetical protein Q8N44_09150 [Rubrivivax sp.]|nr:hypothetical protein [Rubrivivax sp.]